MKKRTALLIILTVFLCGTWDVQAKQEKPKKLGFDRRPKDYSAISSGRRRSAFLYSYDGILWKPEPGEIFLKPEVGTCQSYVGSQYSSVSRRGISYGVDYRLDRIQHRLRFFHRPDPLVGTKGNSRNGPRARSQKHLGSRIVLR